MAKSGNRKLGHAAARRKGLQFERDVANAIKHIFPEARRHLEFQDDKVYGIDLVNTGEWKIQCKRFQKYVSIATISEVKIREDETATPVLVTAGNNLPAMAVLPLADFIRLIEAYEREKLLSTPEAEDEATALALQALANAVFL